MASLARLSLRSKWTLALLVTALVPLLVIGLVNLKIQRDGLMDAEKELQGAVAMQTAKAVGFAVTDITETSHRVGRLLTSASTQSERDPESGATIVGLAKAEVEACDSIASVSVYDQGGEFVDAIVRTPSDATAAPVDRSALPAQTRNEATAKRGLWKVATRQGTDSATYTEPLVVSGKVTGFLVATAPPGSLSRIVSAIGEDRFRSRDAVLVVDEHLDVLAAAPDAALKVGVGLRGKFMFTNNDPDKLSWDVAFQSNTGVFLSPTGERMRGTFSTLARHRWLVVVQRPERDVLAALRSIQRAFVVAVMLAGLASVVAGTLLGSRGTRPIERLVALTRSYSERRFRTRSDVATGDELEELGRSLEAMADAIAEGEEEIARKTVVESQLSRYLPAQVASAIAKGERTIALGGERRKVTVVFADIASFTTFAEGAPPEDVVTFLNEVFTILSAVVFRNGGMVDKFMGDCIMAVFGATEDQPDHCARGLAAAEDMHRFVESQNADWRARFGFDVKLGIGVTTGDALVGNLGSEERMEFTVIGDTINTAARLESMAQAGQTLVSRDVVEAVDGFDVQSLGTHLVRGKRDPIELFELVSQ